MFLFAFACFGKPSGQCDMRSLQQIFDKIKSLPKGGNGKIESEIADFGPTATGFLLSALSHHDQYVRLRVVRILAKMKDPRSITDLVVLFTNPDESVAVRDASGDALGLMEHDHSIEALIGVVKNDSEFRWRAAEVLAKMGESALPSLIKTLGESSDPFVRSLVVTVLRKITGKSLGEDPEKWRQAIGMST